MNLLPLFLLALSLFARQQAAHKQSDKIEENELKEYLVKQFECEQERDQIYLWKVEQFDFLGKGYDQAVVVASTCMRERRGRMCTPFSRGMRTENLKS